MRLVALAMAGVLVGCLHDDTKILGPDTALALHFDSLSAQASASSQENRVAALNLALRAIADGTTPGTLILSNGLDAKDTATYTTVSWTMASVLLNSTTQTDSVKDSLLVFVGWRGVNADTMIVARTGDPGIAPQVQSELAILGLTNHLVTSDATDTVTSGALVAGNTVAVADSGSIEGDFGVFGAVCAFVTVSSIANDNVSGEQCNRELLLWQFGLRFSPSVRWSLPSGYSSGVVVVH
ncbi:MAG TPA: hypothetical protein VK679_01915 [Gemmatimonadaceae bacterium]|nr:hypothetical protein [Gemmatimonadaceae bacterium]